MEIILTRKDEVYVKVKDDMSIFRLFVDSFGYPKLLKVKR